MSVEYMIAIVRERGSSRAGYADRILRDHYGIPVQTASRRHGSK